MTLEFRTGGQKALDALFGVLIRPMGDVAIRADGDSAGRHSVSRVGAVEMLRCRL